MIQQSTIITTTDKTPVDIKNEIDNVLKAGKYVDLNISPTGDFIILITES